METESYKFGPRHRIKKKSDFARLQSAGTKLHSKHFLILVGKSALPVSRLGITVTVKVNRRSAARNLLKRRLREIFRLSRGRLKGHFDIVVIARQEACLCPYADIRRELLGTLYHHGFLKRDSRPRS